MGLFVDVFNLVQKLFVKEACSDAFVFLGNAIASTVTVGNIEKQKKVI